MGAPCWLINKEHRKLSRESELLPHSCDILAALFFVPFCFALKDAPERSGIDPAKAKFASVSIFQKVLPLAPEDVLKIPDLLS